MADPDSRAGGSYLSADILGFLADIHAPHDAALDAAFHAAERDGLPPIQVGPSEGKALQLLLRLVGAQRVVEIGTLAGYSAIWIARALPPDGHLWTLENEPHHAEVARRNLAAAGLMDRVTVIVGDALDSLRGLESQAPLCAVFVDADKGRYDRYGAWAARHLRPGGLLIGDNAFFFGRLLEDTAAAAAMRRFHEQSAEDFDGVCLPTPDGLYVGVRRGATTRRLDFGGEQP